MLHAVDANWWNIDKTIVPYLISLHYSIAIILATLENNSSDSKQETEFVHTERWKQRQLLIEIEPFWHKLGKWIRKHCTALCTAVCPHSQNTLPALTWYRFISITLSRLTEKSVQYKIQSSSSPTSLKPNRFATRCTDHKQTQTSGNVSASATIISSSLNFVKSL